MCIDDVFQIPLLDFLKIYETERNTLDINLDGPGIIGVHCFGDNSTYISETNNCWLELNEIFGDLLYNRSCFCQKLNTAKSIFGLENLSFIIFEVGPKWASLKKRIDKTNQIRENWDHWVYF